MLNQVISEGFWAARIPNACEPGHLLLNSGRRPDGVTLIPYRLGRSAIWDATAWGTLTASQLPRTAVTAGAAAECAENRKRAIYQPFARDYEVVPLAFETHGPIAKATDEFLQDLAKRIRHETGDPRGGYFFLQRLSLAVQRGNALALVLGGMPDSPPPQVGDE